MVVVCECFWRALIIVGGRGGELSKKNVGIVFMDSTSLSCSGDDDDKWLDNCPNIDRCGA